MRDFIFTVYGLGFDSTHSVDKCVWTYFFLQAVLTVFFLFCWIHLKRLSVFTHNSPFTTEGHMFDALMLGKVTHSQHYCSYIYVIYKKNQFFFLLWINVKSDPIGQARNFMLFFFSINRIEKHIYYIKSNQNLWVLYKVKVIFQIHKTLPAFYLLYFCLCAYSTSQSLFIVFMLDFNLKCVVFF